MFSSSIHERIEAARPRVEKAREELLQFLRSEQ